MATAAPSSDRESSARRPVRNRCEQTDLDLKAAAHWLLLVMNYSTIIDVEVLGISEPGVPKSGLARPAGVLPAGCTHWFANRTIWANYERWPS